MTLRPATIVLPCHSLEDFPTFHKGRQADSLLANWTALWHPMLIQASQQTPHWCRPDQVGEMEPAAIFLVPNVVESELPFGFQRKVESAGGQVLSGYTDRHSLLKKLNDFASDTPHPWLPENSRDKPFFALGYSYLQIQLMTRQLRGSSNLDEEAFQTALLDAVKFSLAENPDTPNPNLQRCFDLLIEEKNCYYPVQSSFVELVLTTPKIIAQHAARELKQPTRNQNWLVTGRALEVLKRATTQGPSAPPDPPQNIDTHSQNIDSRNQINENWVMFTQRIENRNIYLVGGLYESIDFRLLPPEILVQDILRFRSAFESLFEATETRVFAQRRPGLTSHYPALLESTGFGGALHMRFEPVPFPHSSSGNIRWEGEAVGGLTALTEPPRDANRGESFLRLGLDIGEQIDSAHLSTMVLAHWPGQSHFAFHDLLNTQKFGPVFGQFVLLDDYFDEVYDPGYPDDYPNSEYGLNGLKRALEAGTPNPVSAIVEAWHQAYQEQQKQIHLACQISLADSVPPWADDPQWLNDTHPMDPGSSTLQVLNLDLPKRLVHLQIPGKPDRVPTSRTSSTEPSKDKVVLADHSDGIWDLVVDLPSYGSTKITTTQTPNRTTNSPQLFEDRFLRNEFFEVELDAERGGIRGINLHQRRRNLLSQRLSLRTPGSQATEQQPGTPSKYHDARCDSIEVIRNNSVVGIVQTTNSIYVDNQKIGECLQTMKLFRGSHVLDITVQFDLQTPWSQDPNHYFCSRLAWKHDSEELLGGVHGLRSFIAGEFPESASYLEWVHPKHQLTLLPAGIPFHRRSSARTLDTILAAQGETQNKFRFGIGVNVPLGELAAREFVAPPILMDDSITDRPVEELQNLFHLDRRNLLVTHANWITDADQKVVGCKLWVREIQGKSGNATITCRKQLSHASRVNFLGEFLFELETKQNAAMFTFQSFEFGEIHLYWKQ